MSEQSRIDRLAVGETRAGIIFNPLSGRNRKAPDSLRRDLTRLPNSTLREIDLLEDAGTSIRELMVQRIDLLIVAGGDGLIQAVVAHLLAHWTEEEWPLLTVLPGGTTNMTAQDLGIRGSPRQVLGRLRMLLARPRTPELVTRPALSIRQSGRQTIHGMFFGGGLIARGVKYSRSSIKDLGLTGGLFSCLIALRSIVGALRHRSGSAWSPVRMTVRLDGGQEQSGEYLLVFASTLNRLVYGIRPYWGTESAPIHVTLIDQARRHLWRRLPGLLRGEGAGLEARQGYHSYNVRELELVMTDEYIVDGELYYADARSGPLRLSVTAGLTFVIP